MTTPRYIIDSEEFGCGQTVTRVEEVSTIVEIVETIEEENTR